MTENKIQHQIKMTEGDKSGRRRENGGREAKNDDDDDSDGGDRIRSPLCKGLIPEVRYRLPIRAGRNPPTVS